MRILRDEKIDNITNQNQEDEAGWFSGLIGLACIAFLVYSSFNFTEPIHEKVKFNYAYGNSYYDVTTARHYLGGDIKYMDQYFIYSDKIIKNEINLLGEKSINVPNNKIKSIEITENIYDYEFIINYDEGSFFNRKLKIYVDYKDNYEDLKSILSNRGGILITGESMIQSIFKQEKYKNPQDENKQN